ncbi:MAG: hypothetical protein ACE5FC_08760, partial [Myxococcota bacterium]
IHDRILAAGSALGLDTLDLLPALKGHDAEDLKIFPNDALHPNPLGHRLIAYALAAHIRANYLGGDGG